MARKTTSSDEDIIDLTELIETGGKTAKASPPPPDDDLEDLLAQTEAADHSHVASSPSVVDAHEELDMVNMGDIDNLLESLDIPAQPRSSGQSAQPTRSEDLDNVLDDLLSPGQDTESAPPVQPAQPAKDSFVADLDAILGDVDDEPGMPKAAPKAAPSEKPKPAQPASLAQDPDDLLSPAPPKSVAPSASRQQAEPAADNLDDELDDLLSSFEQKPSAPPRTSPAASAAVEENLAADLDDILSEVEPPAPVQAPTPPVGNEAPSSPRRSAPIHEKSGPTDLDALLDDVTPSPARPVAPVSQDVPASATETALPVQVIPQDLISGICQNVMANRDNGVRESMNDFSRQLGAQTAHVDDMRREIADLRKRLMACEAKLTASRARIASLEKSMESVASLEDLLKEGTPMNSGFTTLIATAVGNALKSFSDQREVDPALREQLKHLDEGDRCANARLDMLEKRLDDLEPNFNIQVEKAAASAAARILHEEIGKLVSGI